MEIVRLDDAPGYDPEKLVAVRLIEGDNSNVRVIRLSPGQSLPGHTHGVSDLMLFAAEGDGVLNTENGDVTLRQGSLAYYRGHEQLRVSNEGERGLTLLAVLAPAFPPR